MSCYFFVLQMVKFKVKLYYGGVLLRDPNVRYIDYLECEKELESDDITCWCFMDMLKEIGYDGKDIKAIHYRVPKKSLNEG